MANFDKYTKAEKNAINDHNTRTRENHSNKNIDKEKTEQNYYIYERENYKQYAEDRIEQSQHLTRANIIHQIGFVIHLPKDYDGDERTFFQNTHDFNKQYFGEENCLYSVIHKDEKGVHMHSAFLPITEDNRLCAKQILNREFLQHYHEHLQEHLRQKDPQHTINILSEDKQKEKDLPMREYKLQKELKEIEEKEKQLQERQKNYEQTKDYNNLVDRYCLDKDISIHQYYRDVFMYDRDLPTMYGTPIPEAINPERPKEEQQHILEQYKEEHEIDHEKDHSKDR